MNKLSRRIQAMYDLVKPCHTLVEIGCDHCWLSIFLVKDQKVMQAIASDLNQEPLEACKLNIRNSGDFNIKTIISDGFKSIKDKFDCGVIAGMGAKLIIDIIDHLKNIDNIQLILQPQNNEYLIRSFLQSRNIKIEDEVLVEENGFTYIVISTGKEGVAIIDDYDIFIGPKLKHQKTNLAIKKFTNRLNHLKRFVRDVTNDKKQQQITQEIKIITKYLEQ